jgi:hypothetical protein
MEASGICSSVWSPCFLRLFPNVRGRLKAGLQANTQRWRTLTKPKNDIQTILRELPLDKLEKLGGVPQTLINRTSNIMKKLN